MDDKNSRTAVLTRRVAHEFLEYAIVSIYLYICFGVLQFYKTAILHANGVSYLPYGIAVVKALILGKFILLGNAAGLGDRFARRRPIYVIIHKALMFLLLLLVLSLIEEIIVGLVDGRPIGASVAAVGGGDHLQLLATSAIMLLILVPYIAFRELNEVLGEGRLRHVLLKPRLGRKAAAGAAGGQSSREH